MLWLRLYVRFGIYFFLKPKSFVCIFLFDFIVICNRVAFSFRENVWFGNTLHLPRNHDIVEQLQLYYHFSFNIHLSFTATQSHYFMLHCYIFVRPSKSRRQNRLRRKILCMRKSLLMTFLFHFDVHFCPF